MTQFNVSDFSIFFICRNSHDYYRDFTGTVISSSNDASIGCKDGKEGDDFNSSIMSVDLSNVLNSFHLKHALNRALENKINGTLLILISCGL